jgi:hypothetical protein
VAIGIQLTAADRALVNRDYCRQPLPADVNPGSSVITTLTVPAPSIPGASGFKIDLLIEGLTWFEPRGSQTAFVPLRVI